MQEPGKICVTEEFDADLSPVIADGEKLKQVLLNLFKNALEAMPDGGVLKARAVNHRSHVMLEISDTGIGIPEDIDIFQLFTTTKPSGTGLGLSIVRQIVEAHGGSITCRQPAKGTTFRLTLPLAETGGFNRGLGGIRSAP